MAMGSSATDQVERNWNFKRHVKVTFTGVEIYRRNRIYIYIIVYIYTYQEHLLYRFHLLCSSCDKCDKPVTIVSCGFALWAAQSPSFTASYSCRVCLKWVSGHSVKSYLPHLPEPTGHDAKLGYPAACACSASDRLEFCNLWLKNHRSYEVIRRTGIGSWPCNCCAWTCQKKTKCVPHCYWLFSPTSRLSESDQLPCTPPVIVMATVEGICSACSACSACSKTQTQKLWEVFHDLLIFAPKALDLTLLMQLLFTA